VAHAIEFRSVSPAIVFPWRFWANASRSMLVYRLRKLCQSLASRRRALWYRLLGMRIEGKVWLAPIEPPLRPHCITLRAGAALDRDVTLLAVNDGARIIVGARCYVNRHTMFDAAKLLEVGDDTMIGPFCYLTDHDHTFGAGVAPGQTPLVSSATRIGARCWLGAHVSVLKGVTIGDGTVVGAGSVVTKDLPAGVLAVGTPARVVRELAAGEEPAARKAQ
jgi:acetyltransferase-like isoleucine patch superfamily enzyme